MKTTLDIIAEIEARLAPTWGPTTLSDPQTYAADPLVQSQLGAAEGLSRLYQRFEGWTGDLTPQTSTGAALTAVAAMMGQPRNTGMRSFVPGVVTGDQGAELLAGSILVDNNGFQWTTISTVQLERKGIGFVNLQSPVGSFPLQNGELRLETPVAGIAFATNSAQPDLGGADESDESLRRRLLRMTPHWRVKETGSALVSAVSNVPGVIRAHVLDYPCTTDCKKKMVAVIGGTDAAVAQAIYDNAPFAVDSCLDGDSSFEINCTDVKFQRMCPVEVKIRLWKDCKCANQTPAQGVAQILANANKWGIEESYLTARLVTRETEVFTKAEFCLQRRLLASCGTRTIDDPVTGATIPFFTNKISGVCRGFPVCASCVWQQTANLQPYEYPVLLAENIEVMKGCPVPTETGCGC